MVLAIEDWKKRFDKYKAFSDFLAFHARCYFCVFIGWYALASETVDVAIALDSGSSYAANPFSLELAVFLLLLIYSSIMFFFICRAIWDWIASQSNELVMHFYAFFFAFMLILEIIVFLTILWIGFQQPINATGNSQRIYCLLDRRFGPHRYGFGEPLQGCDDILANSNTLGG